MNVPLKSDSVLDNNSEIIVRSLKQPTVTNVSIKDNTIELTIEKELGVEIVGNTKVIVSVEDYEDDYEELLDDNMEEEVKNIKDDYLDNN